jgi:hypothetical protein
MAKLVLIVAMVAIAAPIASGASDRPGARVSVAKLAPLTVRGSHFKPNEGVTVEVTVKVTRVARVRASSAGAFTVTFRSIRLGRCAKYAIEASGDGDLGSFTGYNSTCLKKTP